MSRARKNTRMDKIIVGEVPGCKAHIVPCEIQYTGPANTKDYFTPSKEKDLLNNNEICYFRGCKFVGKNIDISKYDAYVFDKSESLAPGETEDDFKVTNTYTAIRKVDELTVYSHDRVPKLTDPYRLINHWDHISSIIHTEGN